jgi:hypothetical protein
MITKETGGGDFSLSLPPVFYVKMLLISHLYFSVFFIVFYYFLSQKSNGFIASYKQNTQYYFSCFYLYLPYSLIFDNICSTFKPNTTQGEKQ